MYVCVSMYVYLCVSMYLRCSAGGERRGFVVPLALSTCLVAFISLVMVGEKLATDMPSDVTGLVTYLEEEYCMAEVVRVWKLAWVHCSCAFCVSSLHACANAAPSATHALLHDLPSLCPVRPCSASYRFYKKSFEIEGGLHGPR